MADLNLPLLSVVTPSFNQVDFLEEAIRSVLGQDYPKVEYIVMDGGSDDGSLEIIKKYSDRLAHWESGPDEGQSYAINKGLRRSKGEIVAWLNSDDVYLPGAFSEAIEVLRRNPEVGLVYSDGFAVDAELRLLDPRRYHSLTVLDLLSFDVLLQPTVFMRKSVLEDVGYLNESYDLILDHELWLRIASSHPVLHVPRYWALERSHARAKTIGSAGDFVEEAHRMLEEARASGRYDRAFREHPSRIEAGRHVFAARRLIDAAEYRGAVGHLWRAALTHPATAFRYWYKVVQGIGSALGLAPLFFWYRRVRRRIQFGGRALDLHYLRHNTVPDSAQVGS